MELKLKQINDDVFELDVRGNTCPFPQIFTELALKRIESGRLEVITDNPPSARDLPIVLKRRGYQVELEKEGDHWRIKIWK